MDSRKIELTFPLKILIAQSMDWKFFFCLFLSFLSSGFGGTPSEALKRLTEGNERYAKDQPLKADHSADRRQALLVSQAPFATIVSCSDSRVTPEVIFDKGIGDLFIVRVAGNVVGPIELDSIDYSIKALGSSLILVLGHESCGAVKAVLEKNTADIESVAALIQPAVKKETDWEKAIKANVRSIVAGLKKKPVVKQLLGEKKIGCIGAYYHLETGEVEILK